MPNTRRHFLQATTIAGLAASRGVVDAGAQQRVAANDRIQVALIGAGGMGSVDVSFARQVPGTELVAACDVYDGRLIRAKEVWGSNLFTTRDHREILARKDIDAVIVATCDHWHAQIAIDALNAGKDVYLEKPMVHSIGEGKAVIEAQGKTGRILQVGSQRVSSIVYQKAKELLKTGVIGELNMVEAWWDRNSSWGAWQYSIAPDASPSNVDWDRFLGKAPKRPFEPIRLFRWRNYRDYGTGVAGDLFVHLFSGIHFVLDSLGPARIFATGGLRYWKDGRDVPDVLLGLYDYPEGKGHPAFTLALRVNFANGTGDTSGFRFVGSEGVLSIAEGVTVSRFVRETEPGLTTGTFPKAIQEQCLKEYRKLYPVLRPTAQAMRPDRVEKYLPPPGYSDNLDHHQNFFRAVRERKPVLEDPAFGFRAAAPAVASNVSYFEQRVYHWDPETMTPKV
jgi:predicted dehydrogenase